MNYLIKTCICFLMPLMVFPQQDRFSELKNPSVIKQVSFRELTVNHGLSQNSVVSISQDSLGYMWFATQDGLNKYDGKTFTIFNKQFEDVTRPTYSKLGKTYLDNDGVVWIISKEGLEKFSDSLYKFKSIKSITSPSCMVQHINGSYLVGTYGNGLFQINPKHKDTQQVFKEAFKNLDIYDFLQLDDHIYVSTSKHIFKIKNNKITKLEVEGDVSNFSAFAYSENQTIWCGTYGNGLYYKAIGDSGFKQFKNIELPQNLNIQDVMVDKNNKLWIATYGDGIYLYDLKQGYMNHFMANKNDPYALHYDDVLCLYEDFTGTIWLGTDGAGLSYYDEHLNKFNLITNDQTPNNVHVDVVRAITVGVDNTMWLGTSGKGLTRINLQNNEFKTYTQKNSSLKSDRVMSLLLENNVLWIGFQGEGLQMMDSSGEFKNFNLLETQTIWKIYKHLDNLFWLCTRDEGLLLFDREKGVIKQFTAENSALTSNNIRTIEKGKDQDYWIGTENDGLFLLDYAKQSIQEIDAVPEQIKSLYFDGQTLWIGTNGYGLKTYSLENNTVNTYNKSHGLPNLVIYGILSGENKDLWLSSNKGIFEFSLNNGEPQIEIYGNYSGLQAYEFNTGAYFKAQDGTLYFGGLEGVNWFVPSEITLNRVVPRTVISKFEIFNKEKSIIPNATYAHNQNTMTFTFSALHFSQPERNQYKYQLVNHDSTWINVGNTNNAHYTNLEPNSYTFKVISSNYDGVWNMKPATYSFSILKPWYLTNIAKISYAALFLMAIYSIYLYFKWRWHMQTQLQLEHAETERLKKLDDFKTKLYTNISHEFRTPLTLISGPIDHQLTKTDLKPEDKNELNLVKQNANRLLNLVNQMLDLSLIDSGQLRLSVTQGNLNIHLKQIIAAFQYKAQENNIDINSSIENLENTWYDSDVIEKITSNLLSNAIKYSPKNSQIIVDANEQDDVLVMSVININNNVSKKDIGKLFQRFYQDDEASEGIGVGLALVKELVALSKGTIIANTIDDNKIQFSVTFPVRKSAFASYEIKAVEIASDVKTDPEKIGNTSDKALLLIVEDDQDIRTFIASIFKNDYQILEASNGKIGVELALKHSPDLVISDIMMPIKDGITLCNDLKYNELTSHIPIILLTAKVGEENEIKGLRTGADAYITKPFNSEKLKLRVEKLIEMRRQLKSHFSKDFNINPELAITSTETKFLNKLKTVMDQEIANPDFSTERFAEMMHLSRTQLHRKLKAIFDMTSSEFMRNQRLKLALPLLRQSDVTIAEIAYKIGFNTPSYFIKCFKETYGCTPNEFIYKD